MVVFSGGSATSTPPRLLSPPSRWWRGPTAAAFSLLLPPRGGAAGRGSVRPLPRHSSRTRVPCGRERVCRCGLFSAIRVLAYRVADASADSLSMLAWASHYYSAAHPTHSLCLRFCLCAVTCKERRRAAGSGAQTPRGHPPPQNHRPPALPMASRCFFPRDAAADGGRHHQQSSKAAAAALEQLRHGGRLLSREDVGGAVRVKIVVSKRELKQMVAALGDGAAGAVTAAAAGGERHRQRQRAAGAGSGGSCAAGAGPGAEQRLQSLRRRSVRRAAEAARRMQAASGEWEPGLQSIPEEVY